MATEAQTRYILGLMRDAGLSLFISRDHEEIPHIDLTHRTVNNWLDTLNTKEASDVIDHLKALIE